MAKGDKKYDQVAFGLLEKITVSRMALQGHLGNDSKKLSELSSKTVALLKKEHDAIGSILASLTPQPPVDVNGAAPPIDR